MRITLQTSWKLITDRESAQEETRSQVLLWSALAAIVLLAAALRLANLTDLGLANHYYAAAVKSMLQSWHNFFYVAAEPGGSVSVDKPPLGLWIQTLSAAVLGVNSLGLLLPQIVAGLLSVVVLFHLVRRTFGPLAGLLAALALAITPVVVATDRNNTADSLLILTLLLAAWAFIKAAETARLRYLLLGAVLVGLGFNIKMLEAYLPLPAFVALYFLGAREGLWRKVGKLVLTVAVLLVISFSWSVAVDLTPAGQRPYVGSSGDNSEFSLIVGYNGMSRLLGMFRRSRSGIPPDNTGLPQGGLQQGNPPGGMPSQAPNRNPPAPLNRGNPGPGGFNPGGRTPGGFPGGGGGIDNTGQAGPLRLFIPPLSKEASWLLPFGLFGLLLLVFSARLAWPLVREHQAAVLWGGWLITTAIFFSIAGFFHEYYLSILAPPLAALVGIGVIEAWRLHKKRPWLAGVLVVTAVAISLALQYTTAKVFVQELSWLPWTAVLFSLGAIAVCAANLVPTSAKRKLAIFGYSGLVAAMFITPALWSGLTNLHASDNQSLPAAYDGRSNGPGNYGKIQVDETLLDYLQANTQNTYYLMAVPSSMQGSDYILATGRPVLYMGGFMGQDQVLTSESLARLIESGQLRYIFWNAGNGGGFGGGQLGGQTELTNWISNQCQAVTGFDTTTRNTGAPGGIRTVPGSGISRGGDLQVSLYDCAQ